MAKQTHIYDITVSTGEQFKNVRIEGSISSRYSGIATDFIPIINEEGRRVDLTKYQIVKAELIKIERK